MSHHRALRLVFDHLVGACKKSGRDHEVERLGRGDINAQVVIHLV